MDVLPRAGRICLGTATVATGLMQVYNMEFVRLVPKLPAWLAFQPFWAVATGVALVLAGGAILANYRSRAAAAGLAGLLVIVFGLRTPELAANSGALANPAKILALGAGALLAGVFTEKWSWVASVLLGVFLLVCGWAHFQYSGFVDTLVPAWIPPGQRFWTYFSAVALLAGGLGVLLLPTRRLAGILAGVMIFLWVLLLHIPRSVQLESAFELAGVFEAVALAGICWLVAGSIPAPARALEPGDG